MKRKSDLYHLINAMSKSEKRYFTVDVQKSNKKGSRYLELFHLITGMEEYDEKELREKFGSNLPHDKRYLYDAILRSMRDYRSTNSFSAQIREMILDARYLFERELYDQCATRLEYAKELAIELDEQPAILEIIKEERRLVLDVRKPDFDKKLKLRARESEQVVEKIKEELFYQNLYETLITEVVKHLELKTEKDKVNLKKKFAPILPADPPRSNRALRRYYQCIALFNQLLGEQEEVFKNYSEVVEWWERNPKYKEEEFYRYIVDTSNLLHAYTSNGKFNLLPGVLEKMENYSPRKLHDKGVVFQKMAIYKLMYHLNTGDISGVSSLIQQIDKGFSQFTLKTESRLVIMFNISALLFIMEDMEKCNYWCVRIVKKETTKARLDIQRAASILYLFTEIDTDDPEVTEKSIRAVRRTLKTLGINDRNVFESEVLSHVNALNNAPLSEWKDTLKKFKSYLSELKTSGRKIPLGTNELLSYWVNAKLERKSIKQLLGWE